MDEILSTEDGYWCTECKTLCSVYEQGLSCDCGPRWETEVTWQNYPDKWIPVEVTVKKK